MGSPSQTHMFVAALLVVGATALSATTYTLLILAAIAPVAARAAGLSADGSTSRFNGVEKFTIAAPFLALVASRTQP